jgi:hypothetical protein
MHALQQIALGEFHAVSQVVEPLLAMADEFHHSAKSTVLGQFGESLAPNQEPVPHRTSQPLMQCRGMIADFLPRSDHQLRRG